MRKHEDTSYCKRKDYIEEKIEQQGFLSNEDYIFLLQDIKDEMKISLDFQKKVDTRSEKMYFTVLGFIGKIFAIESFQEVKKISNDAIPFSVENYNLILNAMAIVDENRNLYNIDILVEQVCYADNFFYTYCKYISDFLSKNTLPNRNYIIQMEESREKVLSLSREYKKENN